MKHVVYCLLASTLAITLGCGGGSTNLQTPNASAVPFPCNLVSLNDVQAALGDAVLEPKKEDDATCQWLGRDRSSGSSYVELLVLANTDIAGIVAKQHPTDLKVIDGRSAVYRNSDSDVEAYALRGQTSVIVGISNSTKLPTANAASALLTKALSKYSEPQQKAIEGAAVGATATAVVQNALAQQQATSQARASITATAAKGVSDEQSCPLRSSDFQTIMGMSATNLTVSDSAGVGTLTSQCTWDLSSQGQQLHIEIHVTDTGSKLSQTLTQMRQNLKQCSDCSTKTINATSIVSQAELIRSDSLAIAHAPKGSFSVDFLIIKHNDTALDRVNDQALLNLLKKAYDNLK